MAWVVAQANILVQKDLRSFALLYYSRTCAFLNPDGAQARDRGLQHPKGMVPNGPLPSLLAPAEEARTQMAKGTLKA